MLEYVEKLKQEDAIELVDIYIDDGCTGTDSNRPNFQRLLNDIKEKRVNCVVVKDLSRLSRNYIESGHYLEYYFVKFDLRFISIELPTLDSYKYPEQMNSIAVPLQSVFNENHCRETSIKVKGTLDAKHKKGEFIGAFAPYGYMKDPIDKHHLIIDDDVASVIRDIFHWFVFDGMSKRGIVKKLIDMGILSPAAYKVQKGMNYSNHPAAKFDPQWCSRTIANILSNQMYLGDMVQGKYGVKSYKVHTIISKPESEWYIVKNTHEAIIDKEVFEKSLILMKLDTRTAPNKNNIYPFAGFLRCADCNKAMTRKKKSAKSIYYACASYVHKGLCTRHSIRYDRLTSAVLCSIKKQIEFIDELAKLIEEINSSQTTHNSSKRLDTCLRIKEQELKKILLLQPNLYVDWKNGDITREEYHSMKNIFEEKKQKLNNDIENIKEEIKDVKQGINSNNKYFDTFSRYRNIQKIDRGVIVELIKMIHVHEGGNLTIKFNFADQHRWILDFIDNNKKELVILNNAFAG